MINIDMKFTHLCLPMLGSVKISYENTQKITVFDTNIIVKIFFQPRV
jgi:hypothetical protein